MGQFDWLFYARALEVSDHSWLCATPLGLSASKDQPPKFRERSRIEQISPEHLHFSHVQFRFQMHIKRTYYKFPHIFI